MLWFLVQSIKRGKTFSISKLSKLKAHIKLKLRCIKRTKMQKNRLIKIVVVASATVLVGVMLCLWIGRPTTEHAGPPERVSLGLSWIHQAQFSGEYYADQKGLYRDGGLEVTLIPAQIDKDPLDDLLQGNLDFVIAQPDRLIKARSSGAKVKAIAATYRIHPLVFCSLPEKGITKPQDFSGKTVGVAYSEEIILKAMLRKLDINLDEVNIVTRDYNFNGLLSGKLDAQGAWVTDEVQTARRQGVRFKMIQPTDYGITFYADIIVTTEDMIRNNPQLVERFLKATLEGWARAIEDPEKDSELTLLYNNKLDAVHEQDVLMTSLPLIHTGEDQIGWMKDEDWESMYKMLLDEKIIEDSVSFKDLYTMEFLEKVYGR